LINILDKVFAEGKEKDGKTYLKILVENEKVIENALIMFAGIFSQKKM